MTLKKRNLVAVQEKKNIWPGLYFQLSCDMKEVEALFVTM